VVALVHGGGPASDAERRFLEGRGRYVGDIESAGAAHVVFVRSPVAHGRVAAVDVTAASAAPGVLDVVSGRDCDLAPIVPEPAMLNQAMVRSYLASDTVRFAGEAVAAVVAETLTQAIDAAELVRVDIEPLPAVVDPEAALADGVLVHHDAGTNIAFTLDGGRAIDFDECDVAVRASFVNRRVAPCPLETRAVLAVWEGESLVFFVSAQGPHPVRDRLAPALGVPKERVRVVCPDVGGAFGAKGYPHPEEILVAWLARRVGRPLRWMESRTESMLSLGHGRGQHQLVELGGRRDGTLTHYRLSVVQECGAYPRVGSLLPMMALHMMTGPYRIDAVEFHGRSVVTNTAPTGAYRGAGRPEPAAALERAIDLFAGEVGMDPVEVRRRNLIPATELPCMTPTGASYDSGDYRAALDAALAAADYEALRAEQRDRRARGDGAAHLGIGVAAYVEVAGQGRWHEYGRVRIRPDGTVHAATGSTQHGQGHTFAWARLVENRLGTPPERVEIAFGDSDLFPDGNLTAGSRSAQSGAVAIDGAAREVLALAREVAADLLEAHVDDVVFDRATARFHVIGAPASSITLAQAAAANGPDGLGAEVRFDPPYGTYPYGAHVAVVEVDGETGAVRLVRLVAVDDAGTILDHARFDGQVHGGVAQGVAQALYEEVVYDGDGNLRTANLADYGVPSAAELPSFDVVTMEVPTAANELGAKGVGESGTVGATPAVQNAVVDALAHLGVRHIDMPTVPERIWRALNPG
jgi:carbon-monoxide dehydrogenase large subunit